MNVKLKIQTQNRLEVGQCLIITLFVSHRQFTERSFDAGINSRNNNNKKYFGLRNQRMLSGSDYRKEKKRERSKFNSVRNGMQHLWRMPTHHSK